MNRLIGPAIVMLWLVAMASLVHRDVLPYWEARDVPHGAVPDGDYQVAILDAGDRRVGTGWVSVRNQGGLINWQSTTVLTPAILGVPEFTALPRVVFDTGLTFQSDGALTNFESHVFGLPLPVSLSGQLLGIDYSCVARFGGSVTQFSLDARHSKRLGETLRPFTHLPDLRVGQSWRIHALDPISLITSRAPEFTPMLVRVADLDRIQHNGAWVECFRVESELAVAWVDRLGRILVQRVDLPLVGKLTLRDEPFDQAARARLREQMRSTVQPDYER